MLQVVVIVDKGWKLKITLNVIFRFFIVVDTAL